MPAPREAIAERMRRQAGWCERLGSPMYARLLGKTAADLEGEGRAWDLLAAFADEPEDSALALRLMGAVHRLVLMGDVPELARHYPSVGGDGDIDAAWPHFERALSERRKEITALMTQGCQTNEVGRCAALLGGFLEVAARDHLPLRILELGASAGLNARWDRYRYEAIAGAWGDQGSAVRFLNAFEVAPPLHQDAQVIERRACDLRPLDPTSEEGALALRSFLWADQLGRLALLDGAIAIAAEVPINVERIDAASFLERELASVTPGVATIVYHSVFWQYVAGDDRARILAAIADARYRAAPTSPVHHLRMEPGEKTFEIRLDGEVLGTTQAHGTGVRWLRS